MTQSLTSPSLMSHKHKLLDRLGATGSMLCAVHCAALPLVLGLAPAIGAGLANENFEIGFIALASVIGLISLVMGYRRHARSRAFQMLLPGIAMLWCAVLIPPLHHNDAAHALVMTLGGTLIAAAHVLNLRLSHWHAFGNLSPIGHRTRMHTGRDANKVPGVDGL